jgi:hypothetical protein
VSSAAKHAVYVTIEQLLKSEQPAAEWIRKMRKIPPSLNRKSSQRVDRQLQHDPDLLTTFQSSSRLL